MSIPAVARSALLDAMAQFNRELRDTPEWVGWEQNKAHLYAIEHEGNRYPAKQIVSMATGLPVSEFSGGRAPGDANAFAVDRGFEVTELRSGRNPTWVRDELILALDAYLSFSGNPPDKDSPEIVGLSTILNRLAQYLGLTKAERFRNANGVYMKLMNFRRFDPVFTGAGKVGLSRGGKAEEEVWHEFAHNPARCHAVAETIRRALENIQEDETITDLLDGDIEEAEEGRIVSALHRRYERDKKIVQKAKKWMLAVGAPCL